jgi:hypothetical protein
MHTLLACLSVRSSSNSNTYLIEIYVVISPSTGTDIPQILCSKFSKQQQFSVEISTSFVLDGGFIQD